VGAYWKNLENWRIIDKMRKNESREKLFNQVGDENNMDLLPMEKRKNFANEKRGELRRAVLNLKNNRCFRSRFFLRDLDILLLALEGKNTEEIKKIKKIKDRGVIYVAKNRILDKLKKSIKEISK